MRPCGVTDHAVLRACERWLGVETQPLRRAIARRGEPVTDRAVLREISALGAVDVEAVRAALVPVRDWVVSWGAAAARWRGMRFVVVDGVLVTVLPT